MNEFDVAMMRRAMGLAMRGRGTTEPNPSVGCVIVKEGRVIGEGHTQPYGGAHAEPTALASCVESPAGATAYVTLEPCCHKNKQTPPCAPRVIAAGIRRVVVGCLDPNPAVNGKGLEMLRAAGVEVEGPVLEGECKQLIAPFIARVTLSRPYVTLKWAETADGKIAGAGGRRVRISNEMSTRVMHQLRGRCDAIMVSVATVLNDDPLLTARDAGAPRRPLRVILDAYGRTPFLGQLARTALEFPTLIYCADAGGGTALREVGVEVIAVASDGKGHLSWAGVFADLHARGVTHLMVEPGRRLSRAMLDDSLWDRAWVFRSPMRIGSDELSDAPAAPVISVPPVATLDLAGDTLGEYLNHDSPVYFAASESADIANVRNGL